ncbi:YchJ family metal-binding protein [Microbacterium sp.]|uniref:YchJ family protein n=1 Tax=Microbacterium sp. TaxID=51671 RepID=UPI00281180E5|nr:YchJ family metal-binding protein [Microbacterium sp.]
MTLERCPCGSGRAYAACCGPLHAGARLAETPEELMRSRYSAYAKHDADYLLRTWHPRTRPQPGELVFDELLRWTGLEVTAAEGSTVDFVAIYETGATGAPMMGALAEHARFDRRGGRWVYVDGDVTA